MDSVNASNSNRAKAEEYATLQAEKDELKAQHEQEMNRLKKSFESEEQNTNDRYERTTQAAKLKNYENLNAIKRAANRSEQELQNNASDHFNQSKEEVYHKTISQDTAHRMALSKAQLDHANELQRLSQLSAEQQNALKENTVGQTNTITQDAQAKINALQEQKNLELSRQQQNSQLAKTQIQTKYEADRAQLQARLDKEHAAVQNRVSDHLDNLRKTNAARLGAYTERLSDPFYHMVRFDADVSENESSVRIKVKVPAYERENVRLQVATSSAKIIGIRSNQEEFESGPGRKVSTSAQQSFSETVALPAAVDARSLRLEEEGEYLVYVLDKLGGSKNKPVFQSTQHAADRTHAKEPDFPASLPKATPQASSAKSKTIS
jgi:HSP20 family molecular chaperone IbpA